MLDERGGPSLGKLFAELYKVAHPRTKYVGWYENLIDSYGEVINRGVSEGNYDFKLPGFSREHRHLLELLIVNGLGESIKIVQACKIVKGKKFQVEEFKHRY